MLGVPLASSAEGLGRCPATLVEAALILVRAQADADETSQLEAKAKAKNSSTARLMNMRKDDLRSTAG